MTTPFTVDGRAYNVSVPAGGLKRSFQVLDGPNAGRLMSGDMERDIIGTYYNYTLNIETRKMSLNEYDELYETLSAPVNFHTITVPYGQRTLSFTAYVTDGEDSLTRIANSKNYWTGLSIKFVAKAPQRT